ncbi:MAG TPA: DUF58 domain-containing protein [Steroidobacteraceae bacterium]|jgi:uncharacterized protein (DUF58 family)|nr:DUF58 domain-containing protein [Steroidobacteraceae bacterium]
MLNAVLPSKFLIAGFVCVSLLCAALAFTPLDAGMLIRVVAGAVLAVTALCGADVMLSMAEWRRSPLKCSRRLPHAFAIGVPVIVQVALDNAGAARRKGLFQEYADAALSTRGLPMRFELGPRQQEILEIEITPTMRGVKRFEAAGIRLRSRLGLFDLGWRIGVPESRRVFPNFETQARFAWLAGDRRIPSTGLRSVQRRGSGTDFDQLVDYQAGDPIRHIDWKATEKHHRPIVRKFQDERDQDVMILLDCGRRMRADDTQLGLGTTHFDQCLNALMLVAFVALSHGDAVGAMTFGTAEESQKRFAPRKGRHTLNALMTELADVEPTATYSDYERAAADCLSPRRKRGLIVMITNSRNEDAPALCAALALLRTRHAVIVANLREAVVDRISEQPLAEPHSALECAAAQDYVQARDRLLRRIAMSGVRTVDCTPERLGVELVNRYEVLKRTGSI